MHLAQLQHVILEIGERFALTEVFVIGSSAILAVLPDPPDGALTVTRDVDIIPPDGDERTADRISFVIGEGSAFDIEYGYHAPSIYMLEKLSRIAWSRMMSSRASSALDERRISSSPERELRWVSLNNLYCSAACLWCQPLPII